MGGRGRPRHVRGAAGGGDRIPTVRSGGPRGLRAVNPRWYGLGEWDDDRRRPRPPPATPPGPAARGVSRDASPVAPRVPSRSVPRIIARRSHLLPGPTAPSLPRMLPPRRHSLCWVSLLTTDRVKRLTMGTQARFTTRKNHYITASPRSSSIAPSPDFACRTPSENLFPLDLDLDLDTAAQPLPFP
ncbi:hypothetical protein BHE74_00043795 [Ensete ventricosum]|uniref:Uncharacterized protein n=1 Tax=Ensete ventricosum TaxID=4639 RepID=A0A445MLK8_ENSVE|nr:hypothetical protein BHE74_00043795 [Ensete ventricosum]RZR75115.1 hypothetical protein BHM03_00049735 [Ensete ventricosum]